MNKAKKSDKHSAGIAERKDENPRRKSCEGLFKRETRIDIAIQAIAATVFILTVAAGVAGVSNFTHKVAITLWLGSVAVVLTLIGFGLYFQKQIWKAADPHRALRGLRPELSIEKTACYLSAGKPIEVRSWIVNRGSLTAYDITLESTYFLGPPAYAGPIDHNPNPATDRYPVLASGAGATAITFCGKPLSLKQVLELQNRITIFVLYSEGQYIDEDGIVYPIDFCHMYEPGYSPYMRICPTEYWPEGKGDSRQQESDP